MQNWDSPRRYSDRLKRISAVGLRIVSIAMEVPERVETAEELAPRLGVSAEWIAERTGVLRRHVADERVSPAALAAAAARRCWPRQARPI